MRYILLSLLLLLSIQLYSQDSKYSIGLSYPIQTGNNFISDKYTGIIDIEFRARFLKTEKINIGFQFNSNIFKYEGNVRKSSFKTLYMFQPKFYVEIVPIERIRPIIGAGYSLLTYRKTGKISNGSNFSLGLIYDLSNKIFVQIQYDIITGTNEFGTYYSTADSYILPEKLDSDNSFLKIGIGYKL